MGFLYIYMYFYFYLNSKNLFELIFKFEFQIIGVDFQN